MSIMLTLIRDSLWILLKTQYYYQKWLDFKITVGISGVRFLLMPNIYEVLIIRH